MGKAVAYIKLMRPLNLVQGAIAIFVCATLMDNFPAWWQVVLTTMIVWSYTGAGNSLNDYYDYEIDKINRPHRPIPSGKVTRKEALILAIILFVLGTALSIPVMSRQGLLVIVVTMSFLITYSIVFKRLPFWGNFIVSAILGMAFIFGTIVFGDVSKGITPFFLAFGFNMIREAVKDMQDVRGDRAEGASTIPLKYGMTAATNWVIILTIVLMIGSILPFLLGVYKIYYLIVLIFAIEIPLLYIIISIRKDNSEQNCMRLSSILKADIFFGLLAIYVGKF